MHDTCWNLTTVLSADIALLIKVTNMNMWTCHFIWMEIHSVRVLPAASSAMQPVQGGCLIHSRVAAYNPLRDQKHGSTDSTQTDSCSYLTRVKLIKFGHIKVISGPHDQWPWAVIVEARVHIIQTAFFLLFNPSKSFGIWRCDSQPLSLYQRPSV